MSLNYDGAAYYLQHAPPPRHLTSIATVEGVCPERITSTSPPDRTGNRQNATI